VCVRVCVSCLIQTTLGIGVVWYPGGTITLRVHTGSCNGKWPGIPGTNIPPALVSLAFIFV